MSPLATQSWITAGVALLSASVIVVTPVAASLPDVHMRDIQLTAGGEDITLNFVRHGESVDNAVGILGTVAPGAPLTEAGEQQADTVGQALFNQYGGPDGVAGIFASGLIRTQETAAPFATLEQMNVTDLSGLNELNAGMLEGVRQNDLTGLLYLAAPLAWTLGQYWVPELGSSDYNGMAFEARVSDAVQTMYTEAMANPVVSANGQITDVAFSHAGTIMTWVMMNVKNPDPLLILEHPLTNTSQVVLSGQPGDWTLDSWAGEIISPTPSLGTSLFVDFRDLITAPQMAVYGIQEGLFNALGTESLAPLLTALQTGIQDVFTAIVQFPQAVIDSIVGALGDSGAGLSGLLEPGPAILDSLASI